MGSMNELEQKVEQLSTELEIQSMLNRIVLGSVIKCLNELSVNKDVYERMVTAIEGMKPALQGKSPSVDQAINEALKMIKNQK